MNLLFFRLSFPLQVQRHFSTSTFAYLPRTLSLTSQPQKSLFTPISHQTQPLWASPKEGRQEQPHENRRGREDGGLNNADKRGESAKTVPRLPSPHGNRSNDNRRKRAAQLREPQLIFPIHRDALSLRWETLPPTPTQLKMADRFFLQHTPEFLWSAQKFKTIEVGNVPEV